MKFKKKSRRSRASGIETMGNPPPTVNQAEQNKQKKLEIVLKCDSVGSKEAVISSLQASQNPQTELKIIRAGIGTISKSDLHMALTGSRLVVGFNVDVMPQIKSLSREQGIEVRLYSVIYKLINELKEIAGSLITHEAEEKITGKAKVIALFKSSRKGIILGCEVLEGTLGLGRNFRIISAMGPVYSGQIESLHIEKDAVKEVRVGQKVGLKITDFKRATIGDLVECFEIVRPEIKASWQPKGGVFHH